MDKDNLSDDFKCNASVARNPSTVDVDVAWRQLLVCVESSIRVSVSHT